MRSLVLPHLRMSETRLRAARIVSVVAATVIALACGTSVRLNHAPLSRGDGC